VGEKEKSDAGVGGGKSDALGNGQGKSGECLVICSSRTRTPLKTRIPARTALSELIVLNDRLRTSFTE